jgi:hypothetical protein
MDTMGSRCGFARCLPGFNDLYMVSCLPLRQNAIVDAARTIDSGTSPRLRQIREGLFAVPAAPRYRVRAVAGVSPSAALTFWLAAVEAHFASFESYPCRNLP